MTDRRLWRRFDLENGRQGRRFNPENRWLERWFGDGVRRRGRTLDRDDDRLWRRFGLDELGGRHRCETETRRRAADDCVLHRRVDKGDLRRRIWRGHICCFRRALDLHALVFITTGELSGEPFSTDAGRRPLGVREQRTFHPFFFEVGSRRHRGVVQTPCDEAIPLIAHRAGIGTGPANLALSS